MKNQTNTITKTQKQPQPLSIDTAVAAMGRNMAQHVQALAEGLGLE